MQSSFLFESNHDGEASREMNEGCQGEKRESLATESSTEFQVKIIAGCTVHSAAESSVLFLKLSRRRLAPLSSVWTTMALGRVVLRAVSSVLIFQTLSHRQGKASRTC
jgi:hypothetical protein